MYVSIYSLKIKSTSQRVSLFLQAGYELAHAAIHAGLSPVPVPLAARKTWLIGSAKSLLVAQKYTLAACIAKQVHDYSTARMGLLKSGEGVPSLAILHMAKQRPSNMGVHRRNSGFLFPVHALNVNGHTSCRYQILTSSSSLFIVFSLATR